MFAGDIPTSRTDSKIVFISPGIDPIEISSPWFAIFDIYVFAPFSAISDELPSKEATMNNSSEGRTILQLWAHYWVYWSD